MSVHSGSVERDSVESVRSVAVVGLGLLGGSVAWAARERRVAERVIGISRRRESAREAETRGIVDEGTTEAARVGDAELVVLATPVYAMADTLDTLAPHLRAGTIVTDVGSVKGALAEALAGRVPDGVHYVGSHPMAGSHETGLAHARADLLEGAACIVSDGAGIDPDARDRVAGFWAGLGARVLLREPAAHDDEVAWVSHLPHAMAFAYAAALRSAPAGAGAVTGGGFRDFTRIAASDPELWADILLTNRKALAGPLSDARQALETLTALLESAEPEPMHRFLASAREALSFGAETGRLTPSAHDDEASPRAEDAPSGGTIPDTVAK